jgi:hypothetical protein
MSPKIAFRDKTSPGAARRNPQKTSFLSPGVIVDKKDKSR